MEIGTTTKWLAPVLLLVLAACGGEAEATPARPPAARPQPAADGPAGPLIEDPTFELRAQGPGPYRAGQEGTFEVRLTPRGDYHVNQEFPMAVALSAPDGVSLPTSELGNGDAAEFSEQRARFSIPFTAAEAGEHTVNVEVDFAVCTPEACMPDHRTLALVLPVR